MSFSSTGKINETAGVREPLGVVLSAWQVKHGILRILSKTTSGSMSIIDGKYVTGGHVPARSLSGYAAVRLLLGVRKGIYTYFQPDTDDEFRRLDQGLRISVGDLMADDAVEAFNNLAQVGGWVIDETPSAENSAAANAAQLINQMRASVRTTLTGIARQTLGGLKRLTRLSDLKGKSDAVIKLSAEDASLLQQELARDGVEPSQSQRIKQEQPPEESFKEATLVLLFLALMMVAIVAIWFFGQKH